MRRPTEKEGLVMPWAGLVGLALLILGGAMLAAHLPVGLWVILTGAASVIMFCLVFWRLVVGGILSGGFWLALIGALWLLQPGIPLKQYGWIPLAVGAVVVLIMLARLSHRRTGSGGLVRRWSRRLAQQDGVASWWVLWRRASAFALRRKAHILRPSLRDVSWWVRWFKLSATELGTRLAKVGMFGIWSPIEDVTLRFGGPRIGKSGEMAGRILDAPGAVICTSTRTDLIDNTELLRGKVGPLYVFNPNGLAKLESTLTFDPLAGCEAPAVAMYRAEDLIEGGSPGDGGDGDRKFWLLQAAQALSTMLHAAALGRAAGGEYGMSDVHDWAAQPSKDVKELVTRLLRRSPAAKAFTAQAVQFFDNNERTQSSITTTILPALRWMISETASAAARPGESIDVAKFLDEKGTLYLLGAEDASTAPLVTALTAHIAREARRIASEQPSGRLDPSLTMVLDEAALICPIPLPEWTSDMGGRNITIHIAAQGRSQLRKRWGDTGAGSIMNNSATVLVYGGARDTDDLATYSKLAGERDEDVATHDHSSRGYSTTKRRQAILSEAQFAQLEPGQVVIIGRSMPPAIGKVEMVWKRHDFRKAARAKQRADKAADRLNRRIATGRPALVEISWRSGWAGFRAWLASLRPADRFTPTLSTTRRVGDIPVSPTDFNTDTDPVWPTERDRHLVVVPPADDDRSRS
ncbi:type IV secretory system conjugative DNA transfer family protein [Microlunatus parietis]|uniref:Type IV secretory pathway TraG/TraD family ATPase VirD4 n=1 Tax=Microlunatus parietis TaxID=682979 RepID=A0A7Y9ICE8_9ACTN|nr:type IV secretory system conjugative DNA transfer family protein [Microlunatus parietis]NYE74240.1 type IV secretory pathway TraG/TraD family ATPase VirD4 [Microlunatus parietis]